MPRRSRMYWEETNQGRDVMEFNQTIEQVTLTGLPAPDATAGQPQNQYTLPLCSTLIQELLRTPENASDQSKHASHQDGVDGQFEWTQVILPVICIVGITGNSLNLLVLTKRRLSNPMRKLERSANFGLTALAFSDLMFSIMVLPYMFLSRQTLYARPSDSFVLFYKVYGVTAINMFLTISTWMVVMLAVERYIVLFYPLKAKCILGMRRTKAIVGMIYLCAAGVMMPSFLHLTVRRCQGFGVNKDVTFFEIWPRWDGTNLSIRFLGVYIRWICPLVAVFLPLTVLSYCNFRLIQGLRRAPINRKHTCPGQPIKEANNKITLTLVIVVFMALVLVTPAEVLKLFNPYARWGKVGYHLASLANTLQAINFAFNFILYVSIDSNFRQICRNVLLGWCLGKASVGVETEVIVLNRNTRSSSSEPRYKRSTISLEKLYG